MAQPPSPPGHGQPPPATGAEQPGDPSMEDILASIRRILSDDEAGAVPAPAAASPPSPPGAEPVVLTLQESMIVSEPEPPPSPPAEPAPTMAAAPPMSEPKNEPAADSAHGSVAAMLRSLIAERGAMAVHRSGPTIEDLVREEIRPLLSQWLDANLPPLVERLVRAEVERAVGRALS